jgi:cold shock CspA family protein
MTGSIKNLNPLNHGFIAAENGQTVYFAASAVWAHDYPHLTVGQAVSFDLLDCRSPKAINVYLFEGRHVLHGPEPDGPVELRFAGFDQANGVRTFHFQAFIDGKELRIRRYCGHDALWKTPRWHPGRPRALLALGDGRTGTSLTETASLALNEKNILAFVESRRVPKRKAFRRQGHFGALNSR